jgi:serine protease inhibitor
VAAAVTSVEMSITSAQPPQEKFVMKVDRPFFFAIRDNATGVVLFMGSVEDPG